MFLQVFVVLLRQPSGPGSHGLVLSKGPKDLVVPVSADHGYGHVGVSMAMDSWPILVWEAGQHGVKSTGSTDWLLANANDPQETA